MTWSTWVVVWWAFQVLIINVFDFKLKRSSLDVTFKDLSGKCAMTFNLQYLQNVVFDTHSLCLFVICVCVRARCRCWCGTRGQRNRRWRERMLCRLRDWVQTLLWKSEEHTYTHRNTYRHTHTSTHCYFILLFNAAHSTLPCKYCKTEKYLLEAIFKLIWLWLFVLSRS